jgi:glutamyl/glutaminyl-tRNA synthetase
VAKFRKILGEFIPARYLRIDDRKMCRIMDVLKGQMKFNSDLKEHLYFFNDPEYETKYQQRDRKVKAKILGDLVGKIKQSISEKEFSATALNKVVSMYLFESSQRGEKVKNQYLFDLVRYALIGKHRGIELAQICEILGRKTVL